MDNNNTSTTNVQEAASFDFKKLLSVFLKNWYWFVISVFLCCSVAVYKVLSTSPQYSRTAILLIKESNVRRASSSEVEALLSQAGQMPSKLANEIVVFQAPSLMSEAVSRLGLTTEYALRGRMRNSIVYSSSVPVLVDFSKIPDDVFVNFVVSPSGDSSLTVSEVVYRIKNQETKLRGHFKVEYGVPFKMDFGMITLNKNPYYYSEKGWTKPEVVTKRSLAATTNMFKSRFTASSQDSNKRMSDVLTLSVTDYNINRADDLINTLITVYNEKWVIDNNKMAASTSVFIEDRLSAIEAELNKVDNTITNYKAKNKMPSVDEASKMYTSQASDIARQIRELESQLSVAKYLRNFMANSVDNNTLIPLPSGINSTAISSQVTEYNNLLLNRNSLIAVSSEKNPMVKDLAESLAAMRAAIVSSVDNQVATLEEQIAFAITQQTQTENKIAQNPSQAMDLVKYERLQKVQENLYLYLLQKREENELSQAFSAYNTRVVNPPYGSNIPVSPRKARILLIAFVLGLMIPAGIFYLQIVTDTKVHSKKDLDTLDLSYLGEIPLYGDASMPKKLIDKFIKKKDGEAPLSELVVAKGNRDIINEAFRITRANLEFASRHSGDKVIMVTSFNPGAGKTFVNLNLACALALNGKKVLLIDGDFRRLTISTFLNLKRRGFADYLAEPAGPITDYIVKDVKFANLDVLPVGTLPPNPSELLNKDDVVKVMNQLRSQYDYIFIDCPPIDIVADTQIIAPLADRTIFVVRAGLFDKSQVSDLAKLEANGKYKDLSLVLNGTEVYGGSSYGYHNYSKSHKYYSKSY